MSTIRPYWLLAPVFLLIGVMIAVFWNYTQDDVFITFVYSRNLAEGVGFVFNPGERVQGTTTPLWALLMAGIYLITSDLLHAGNILGGVCLALTCALLFDLTRTHLTLFARIALCALLASSPLIYASLGMETLFYCLLLTLTLWLWSRGHTLPAFIAAAALTWTRADGVVLAGTLGLLMLWDTVQGRVDFRRTVAHGLVYAAAILPWFVFAWAYFGSPFPNTLGAKQAILDGFLFWSDGVQRWESFYGNNPFALVIVVLVPLGAWTAWQWRELRPLPLWALLYATGYTVLNVTNFWYYTPLLLALIALSVIGAETALRWLAERATAQTALAAGGLLSAAVVIPGILQAADLGPPPTRMTTYQLVGEWIDANTPPNATLMLGDLGIVGYYARRHALDSPGLIVPDMYIKTPAYATIKYKLDYIAAPQYLWNEITWTDWFTYHYVPVTAISTAADFEFSPMVVFRRHLPLETPAELPQGFDLPLTCTVELPSGAPLPEATTEARLFAEDGTLLVEAKHPFLWDVYPQATAAGDETLIEQIGLPLTVSEPGDYTWEFDCAGETTTGTVTVLPIEQTDTYTQVVASWPEFASLRGMVLPEGDTVWSGGSLLVGLDFTALGPASTDYNLFIHVVSADGFLVAQSDGPPQNGARPTNTWAEGDAIIDLRRVTLDPALPAGEYTLIAGWYDWRTGERVTTAAGQEAVTLPLTITNQFPGGTGMP